MSKRILPVVFILFLLIPGLSPGASPSDLFDEANTAYQSSDFSKAIQLYQNIIDQGYSSADLYYNKANAHFKSQQLAEAILNYERAALLSPFDQDIENNLNLANATQQDEINPLPPFFLSKWWNATSGVFSPRAWAYLGLLLFWMGIGGLVLWRLSKVRQQKKRGFVGGLVLIALGLLCLAFSNNRYQLIHQNDFGVLMKSNERLLSAPESESKMIQPIHEGLKMEVLDEIGEWYKVRLLNGEEGWLPQNSIERI